MQKKEEEEEGENCTHTQDVHQCVYIRENNSGWKHKNISRGNEKELIMIMCCV